MNKINWGIIGCGDVTELKSGPAFNKVNNSALVAVMRRDAEKASDYARRHNVPRWYNDAAKLINDPEVNAIYIATPPNTHETYTIDAINAGKPVYVEKPMSLNAALALHMIESAKKKDVKLVVAHYRRAQPMFRKIKELIDTGSIGSAREARLTFRAKAIPADDLAIPKVAWRINPAISGGGLFHDLAPHQLGLMLFFFGAVKSAYGQAYNRGGLYTADDIVKGSVLFENEIKFAGEWDFNASPGEETDTCIITGTEGTLRFSVFGKTNIHLNVNGVETIQQFEALEHVQQPMIEKVVEYFLDISPNPCPPEEGFEVMRLMDIFTRKP